MKDKIINAVVWLVIGAIIALLCVRGCGKTIPEPAITKPEDIRKEARKDSAINKKLQDSAAAILKAKDSAYLLTVDRLKASQQYARTLEKKLLASVEKPDIPPTSQPNDYEAGDLEKEVKALVKNSRERDSLCNEALANRDSALAAKGAQLQSANAFSGNLSKRLGMVLDQQDQLIDYSKSQKKEIRRRKAGNAVWKIVTIVAAGVIVKQALK